MRGRRPRAGTRGWLYFTIGGVLAAVGVQVLVPSQHAGLAHPVFFTAGAAAMVVGIDRNRPVRPGAWVAFLAALLLAAAAHTLHIPAIGVGSSTSAPVGSFPDVLLALIYAPLLVGAGLLGTRTTPDRRWSSELGIVAGSFLVVVAVFLWEPASRAHLPPASFALVLMRPLASMALFTVLTARLPQSGPATPALRLLTGSVGLLVLADIVHVTLLLEGLYRPGARVDLVWYLSAVGFAAASLHPSMARATPRLRADEGLGTRQMQIATGAILLIPGVVFLQAVRGVALPMGLVALGAFLAAGLWLERFTYWANTAQQRERRARALAADLAAANARISASEQRTRGLVDAYAETLAGHELALHAGGMAMWTWDRANGFVARSPHAASLFGLPEHSDEAAASLRELLDPRDEGRVLAAIARAMTTGEPFDLEYRIVRPDGGVRWLRDVGRRVDEEGAEVTGMHGVMIDITDLKMAEADARNRERSNRAILDSVPAATVVLDATGVIIAYNAAWDAATCEGTQQRWDIGDNYLTRWEERPNLLTADRMAVAAGVRDVIARGTTEFACEYEALPAGSWYHLRALPLQGTTGSVVVSHFDITQQKRTEAQLRQAQKMEAVGQLAGGVAHDFNNLLTAISGYCQLLRDRALGTPAGDDFLADLDEIGRAADRATTLVSQLLTFSRRQPNRTTTLDLADTVRSMEALLRRLISSRVEIRTELRDGLWPVKADPAQMDQVIMNLAVNAQDAMPTGGVLTIATSNVALEGPQARALGMEDGRYVRLRISDTGTGMPPEVLAHAMEPFFTTKPDGSGTGLGLAMVYGSVLQAEGQVRIHSEEGIGTVVTVLLPAAEGAPAAAIVKEPPAAAAATAAGTILLVEDEPQVRSLLVSSLERLGYDVLEAAEGHGAMVLAADHKDRIDVLLTDVMMPMVNGPELARRLADAGLAVPVIFMSGYTSDVALPAADPRVVFLQKPFALHELATAVQEAMAAGSPGPHVATTSPSSGPINAAPATTSPSSA